MRLISFALTRGQIREQSKDVTRRLGWLNLVPGERLQGCEKVQGRRNGEPLVRLCVIEVVSVRRERLDRMLRNRVYGQKECRREGFPNMRPPQFVRFFCDSHGPKCTPKTEVTRIEFRYV